MATSRSQCLCVEEITKARSNVENMIQVSLEAIMVTFEETINSWQQWKDCPRHDCSSTSVVQESMLQICARFLSLLEAAIAAYQTKPNSPARHHIARNNQLPLTHQSEAFTVAKHGRQSKETADRSVICLPSKMALGQYELDEKESRHLGLDLVHRMVENLICTLQQMARGSVQDVSQTDARLLGLLSRARRDMDSTSTAIYALP
ncbi:hypothetical protein F5X97DRAFT_342201 [Nemania serpens]|nr:hypothetical protein F5X97DRAFT_342201 [Nemania serpens]